MAGYLLGENAKRDFGILRRAIKKQPNAGQGRHRRVDWLGFEDEVGGHGGGPGGCACCGCTTCLDLCKQAAAAVVSDCINCLSGAPRKYKVYFGGSIGAQILSYAGECTWTKTFGVSTGNYLATLIQYGNQSTVQITYVSGDDVLNLSSGRVAKWKADQTRHWSCICNSTMIAAIAGERFPPNAGLSCEICIEPLEELPADEPPSECEIFGACWSDLDFPGITWEGGSCNLDDPAYTAGTLQFYNNEGGDLCCWETNVITHEPGPACEGSLCSTFIQAILCVNEEMAGSLTISYSNGCGEGSATTTAIYVCEEVAEGSNTFTLDSVSGGPAGPTDPDWWPASLDVVANDCSWGATHPDYGYGCGGVLPEGCGDTCSWIAIPDGEGGWQWDSNGGTGINHCADCGGCPLPDVPASEGATATTYCAGA